MQSTLQSIDVKRYSATHYVPVLGNVIFFPILICKGMQYILL